ncbi:hypothetical protein CCACVL1_08694 [Corchorus capsularis]|uniref:Uncharacterized protein n=1 Tax=Corchorus capsularis TaxID=210143 RepID=A0A1R3IZ73_COCAP|nr:hypothetical protein CCACVL1_08694 [Corchorus capsularis]
MAGPASFKRVQQQVLDSNPTPSARPPPALYESYILTSIIPSCCNLQFHMNKRL